MNKIDAIEWANKKLSSGEESDGCTLSPDFGFSKCCKRHDVMIRFNQGITDKEADLYLRDCIIDHGQPVKAYIYWLFVRASSVLGGWQNLTALICFSFLTLLIYFFG